MECAFHVNSIILIDSSILRQGSASSTSTVRGEESTRGSSPFGATLLDGDSNQDGDVDTDDLVISALNFGRSVTETTI